MPGRNSSEAKLSERWTQCLLIGIARSLIGLLVLLLGIVPEEREEKATLESGRAIRIRTPMKEMTSAKEGAGNLPRCLQVTRKG
jgi:hypothetical protein